MTILINNKINGAKPITRRLEESIHSHASVALSKNVNIVTRFSACLTCDKVNVFCVSYRQLEQVKIYDSIESKDNYFLNLIEII